VSASKEQILVAAAGLYEREGYRGATTRRIAEAAGVNEVTLFRAFGSKAALIRAVLERAAGAAVPPLPLRAGEPHAELSAWGCSLLATMRERRPLQRAGKDVPPGEVRGPDAADGFDEAATELTAYLLSIRNAGDPGDAICRAASEMYVAALQYRARADAVAEGRADRTVCDDYAAVVVRALGPRGAQGQKSTMRAAPPPYVPDATGA
jgi:AcrR family transcriptional regulator